MLSNRDKELAAEVGRQVRYGGHIDLVIPPLPAYIAWPLAGLFGAISYWLRDEHSLFWGITLIFSVWAIVAHTEERADGFGSRTGDLAFLAIYSFLAWRIIRPLWVGEYYILSAVVGLSAFVAMANLVRGIFAAR